MSAQQCSVGVWAKGKKGKAPPTSGLSHCFLERPPSCLTSTYPLGLAKCPFPREASTPTTPPDHIGPFTLPETRHTPCTPAAPAHSAGCFHTVINARMCSRLSLHPTGLPTPLKAGQNLAQSLLHPPSSTGGCGLCARSLSQPRKHQVGLTFSLADFRVSSSIHFRVLRLSSNAFLISMIISLAWGDRS